MRTTLAIGRRRLLACVGEERAQSAVESLVAIGAAVVLLMAMLGGLGIIFPLIAGFACPSVDTAAIPPATVGSCIGP